MSEKRKELGDDFSELIRGFAKFLAEDKQDRALMSDIKEAIEKETYDELNEKYGDNWEIIERLIVICDNRDRYKGLAKRLLEYPMIDLTKTPFPIEDLKAWLEEEIENHKGFFHDYGIVLDKIKEIEG